MTTLMARRDIHCESEDMAMSNEAKVSTFLSLDLTGAQPTSVPMETVHVEVSAENLLGSYAHAFVQEAYRVAPLRAEQVNLTDEEMTKYCQFLMYQRVLCAQRKCEQFRKLKVLYIPVWIQYNLSMIGEVIIREKGLRFVPVMDDPGVSLDEAIQISTKVGAFERDLQIVQDAMPRSEKGDVDVMSAACIAGYVRSLEKVQHVASTYVNAFLGMKLREEAAMRVLYRVQYDDVGYIASVLTAERRIF